MDPTGLEGCIINLGLDRPEFNTRSPPLGAPAQDECVEQGIVVFKREERIIVVFKS